MTHSGRRQNAPKVLVIGPGDKVRGGITSVIATYSRHPLWREFRCRWLATYDDRSQPHKVAAFCWALVKAIMLIPTVNVVHIHAAHRTSFCRKACFFVLAKLFRKKTILHLHTPYTDIFEKRWLRTISRFVFSRVDAVIVVSGYWADCVRKIAPKTSVEVIPNPCVVPVNGTMPRAERDATVLFAGKLEPRKGYQDLLEAMVLIRKRHRNVRLLLAGHGETERAAQLARELGVADSVILLGWLSPAQLHQVFHRASVFCLPSYAEGVPMAMLEAIANGVPVVVTPVGGIPDLIRHGENGLLVTPGHHEGIAEAVLRLLESDDLCETLATNAYESIARRLAPETICGQIADVYLKVASRNGRAPRV